MKTLKYRLYAAVAKPETLEIAMSTAYARVNGGYILVYKKGKAPVGYKEVTEPALHMLSEDDRKWLDDINVTIMEAFALEHAESEEKGIKKFAERFEEALKAQRRKMGEDENAGN